MSLTRREFLKISGAAVVLLSFTGRAIADVVQIPVLMYHELSHEISEEETVSPSLFAAQMEWLYSAGYHAISFSDINSLDAASAQRAVIITFDDGYASFMDYAFPLLKEYRFKATINIIGKHAGGFLTAGEPLLSWDECRYLMKSGLIELGSHTYGLHVWTGNSSWSKAMASFNEKLAQDLALFQKVYHKELGAYARVFAWPYGRFDRESVAIVKKAGFQYILSSEHRNFEKGGDVSNIPRLTISNKTTLPLFRELVERRL